MIRELRDLGSWRVNESGGRDHNRRDAAEPDAPADRSETSGWTAPIIDAPLASGAADTDPGSGQAGWEGDDWAWNATHDVDQTTPDVDDELARIEEAPTSPGVPAVSAGTAALAYEHDRAPSYRRERRSRDERRRMAVGIAALVCFAILIGALIATMGGGGGSAEPKRADKSQSTSKKTGSSTTTSTSLATTTTTIVAVPTTVLTSATVVTRPPNAPPPPATNPPTCNVVTQLLGCH